jgi:hypothetical protein
VSSKIYELEPDVVTHAWIPSTQEGKDLEFEVNLGYVVTPCNPSYSGGRDKEEHGSKPAWANSLSNPISKKTITKQGWWSGSRCRP